MIDLPSYEELQLKVNQMREKIKQLEAEQTDKLLKQTAKLLATCSDFEAENKSRERTIKEYDEHCVITAKLLQENNKRIQQDIDTIKQLKAANKKAAEIATKYVNATEYYDNLMYCEFVEMPPLAKKLVNDAGKAILKALEG